LTGNHNSPQKPDAPVTLSGPAIGLLDGVSLIMAGLLTGKPVSRGAYLGMDQILPPELNDLEFEALRQFAAHPATRHVPSRIQSRLKDIGYAKEVLGGIVLTKDGLQRVRKANDSLNRLTDRT
jgi:hypothetical protein